MSNAISSAVQTPVAAQPAAQTKAAAPQPTATAQAKPQPAPTDTVHISAAAQLSKEAIETPAQTFKEAAGGDQQARRLLAREAAEKKA